VNSFGFVVCHEFGRRIVGVEFDLVDGRYDLLEVSIQDFANSENTNLS
jgi:hypothetical protein